MQRSNLVHACVAFLLVTSALFGQFGGVSGNPIDANTPTTTNGGLGVQWVAGNDTIVVSCRGTGTLTTAPHSFDIYTHTAGTDDYAYSATVAQPSWADGSAWGIRDMAASQADGLVFGGCETGFGCFDATTMVEITGPIVVNGQPTVNSWPLFSAGGTPGAPPNGVVRGVAFVPNFAAPGGTFFTASFAGNLVQFDLEGNVMTTIPNTLGWSIYGLAYDPCSPSGQGIIHLWANSVPNAGDWVELIVDLNTSTITQGGTITGPEPGTAQGGLCFATNRPSVAFSHAGELIGLQQSAPDTVHFRGVHQYDPGPACAFHGANDTRLATAAGAVPTGALSGGGRQFFTDGDFLEWGYDNIAPGAVPIGLLIANFLIDAGPNGITAGGIVPNFGALNAFSIPASTPGLTFTLGDSTGIGAAAAPLLPLGPNAPGDPPAAIGPIPAGAFMSGNEFRLQALVGDANPANPLGLLSTNQVYFQYEPPLSSGAVVTATGTNSFNAVTTSGFFTVNNTDPARSIVAVSFSWFGSSNPAQATMQFDTDQGGMMDVCNGGNSAVVGCLGTYRNGTDVSTGLTYGAGQTVPTCDPMAFSGFVGADPTATVNGYQTLNFAFTSFGPGQLFEYDCDTDGGAGISGDAMAGMICTVTWDTGVVSTGELAVNPAAVSSSIVVLP